MYSYSLTEWILFFYSYCFLGWIWESCYVSIKQKRWVNRGFMHGPCLPIYGWGAITVLLATIPVRDHIALVFICGMIGATLLEYLTGAFMEVLFHVRYWDYSKEPFNFNGHICLKASLGWGLFSVLMIYILHAFIEMMVIFLHHAIAEIIAALLMVIMMVDLIKSFKEAMDLKEMLMHLSMSHIEVQTIRKRLDVIMAIMDRDAAQLKEKLLQSKQDLSEKLIEEKMLYGKKLIEAYRHSINILHRNPDAISKRHAPVMQELKEMEKAALGKLHKVKNKLDKKEK